MKTDRWGCPDWLDYAAYPTKPVELEDWQWRWEFLRRNPTYRAAWERAEANPDTELVNFFESGFNSSDYNLAFACEQDGDYIELALGIGNKMMLDPRTRLSALVESPFVDSTATMPTPEFVERYMEVNDCQPEYQAAVYKRLWKLSLADSQLETEGKIAKIKFDLSMPIKPQLDQCENDLHSTLRRQGKPRVQSMKNRRENWSRHLRVIDADDQGAKGKSIWLEIKGRELPYNEFEKKVNSKINVSSLGDNWITEARKLMAKASLLP